MLVATPIGNTGDLSPRAAAAIEQADVVCCEDTRHSGRLFARLGLRPRRLLSLHEHNERARSDEVVELVASGRTVVLVTDAGTPALSDPGSRVVAAVHESGGIVTVVPGPSAVTAALAAAGLGGDRFAFEGFPPRRGGERSERMAAIAASTSPVVIFEAPGRVGRLLEELTAACGPDRLVAVCRELTKLHEEVWRGPLSGTAGRWPAEQAKGEFVLVVSSAPPAVPAAVSADEVRRLVSDQMAAGLTRRDAVDAVAAALGRSRRAIYDALAAGGRAPG